MTVLRLAAVAACVLAGIAVAAQEAPTSSPPPPAPFRAAVDVVEVNAVVTNQRGELVTDLSAGDFEIREDRRPQDVSVFARVNRARIPPAPGALSSAAVASDVHDNLNADGAVFGVVLDGLHIAPERTAAVRQAVGDFLRRDLSGDDFAALIVTGQSTRSVLRQQFTDRHQDLLARLDGVAGTKIPWLPPATSSAGDPLQSDRGAGLDANDAEHAARAKTSLETLQNLCDQLSGVLRRRSVIVFVSEGIEYNDADITAGRTPQVVRDGLRRVAEAAARANVTIYTIDARMLSASRGRAAFGTGGAAAQQTLRDLADATGGRAAVSAAEAAAAFARIVADVRSYYALGYASDDQDGRYRRIEVRVKRPGLRVWTRRGRFAPERQPESGPLEATALREVMASPLPVPTMPMKMFAVPFKDGDGQAAVLVCLEWPAGDGNFAVRSGNTPNTVALDVSAYDDAGRRVGGARHEITTAFEPQSREEIRAQGLRLMSQIQLPAGDYQLRLSAFESVGGTSGSVMNELHVPDFSQSALSFSGVSVFAWPERPAQLTGGAPAPLSSVLPWPPTLTREFHQGDEIALFAEAYDSSPSDAPRQLSFTASLVSSDGRVVAGDRTDWSSADARGHRREYGVQAKVALKDVPPGVYVLRAEGSSAGGGPRTVADIPVKVIE